MEENTVFIGKKETMVYVTACIMQLGKNKTVTIKARGRAISRAVDVVEIVRRRFIQDATVKEIKIGTEEFTGEDNRTRNVSTMEIKIEK